VVKTKLQYLYSIFVLCGVLAVSYLMVDQKPGNKRSFRTQQPLTYRAEAGLSSQGIDQLLQLESQFRALRLDSGSSYRRNLTRQK
jgi:hypothetical protein